MIRGAGVYYIGDQIDPTKMITRTSPYDRSGSVLRSPDGETFDNIQPQRFGFIARSVRTGERVTFAAHGCEAVEVERQPRGFSR